MNEKQADDMVKSLKKIESYLEAIDWKFWNLYQRIQKEDQEKEATADDGITTDNELEDLADIITDTTPASNTLKPVVKYPSIEIRT
jgi:hypothetical protein